MDMRDGEIQYKIVQRNSADMTAPVVVELLQTAVGTMDKFFPGVMAVTYTDRVPMKHFMIANEMKMTSRKSQRPTRCPQAWNSNNSCK
jgi:hypothetical protein